MQIKQPHFSQEIAELGINDVLECIQENIGVLKETEKEFVLSVRAKALKYNGMTPNQESWIRDILQRIHDRLSGKSVNTQVSVGSLQGLYNMFQKAKEKLKYPAIWLRKADGGDVKIHPFGKASKYAGQLCVTDGKPFGQNIWYGAVSDGGQWTAKVHDEQVKELLEGLSNDPVNTAKKQAKLTGNCCFCAKKLTDEKSTAVGFGPVCAENYGLKEAWKHGVSLWEQMAKEAA